MVWGAGDHDEPLVRVANARLPRGFVPFYESRNPHGVKFPSAFL